MTTTGIKSQKNEDISRTIKVRSAEGAVSFSTGNIWYERRTSRGKNKDSFELWIWRCLLRKLYFNFDYYLAHCWIK